MKDVYEQLRYLNCGFCVEGVYPDFKFFSDIVTLFLLNVISVVLDNEIWVEKKIIHEFVTTEGGYFYRFAVVLLSF